MVQKKHEFWRAWVDDEIHPKVLVIGADGDTCKVSKQNTILYHAF